MVALAYRRGGGVTWYTRDTGGVRCSPDYAVHFGVNDLGLVNVYAKDIALLPEWQQRIWAGFNVGPEGGVSGELLDSQVKAEPADTQAPERYLPQGIALLNRLASEKFGVRILREHKDSEALIARTHRFRSVDLPSLCSLAKDLARLTADSLDVAALQTIVKPPKGTRWGSLKTLENVVAQKVGPAAARKLLGPLFGVFELRTADAHLPSNDLEGSLRLAGINRALPYVHQGRQLSSECVSALYEVADVVKQFETHTP
jgi:hypothetical protein